MNDQNFPEKGRIYSLFKVEIKKLLITPFRAFSLFAAVAGIFALIFEVRHFENYSLEIYLCRLSATLVSFVVLFFTYFNFGKKRIIILIHFVLIVIISSFGVIIFLIPETLVFNSHIISLILFTVALFLSWEVTNQIIVAIYYNIVFASSILLNNTLIYFLPNMFESVLFVMFISMMSIAASSFSYKLRKESIYKSFEVSESEKKFRNIFENSVEGVFQISAESKFIIVNNALIKMLGYSSQEEVLSLDVFKNVFGNPRDGETFKRLLERSGKVKNYKVSLKRKDDSEIIVRINARVDYDENDNPILFEGSMQDFTQQILAEREKEKVNEDLRIEKLKADEMAQKAKSESESKTKFLSSISHEIKTPLNAVTGFFTMLENDLFENMTEMKNFAAEVKVAADSIVDILGKNIDLTKIESGMIELEDTKFNFKEEVEKAISRISSQAKEKGLNLTKQIDKNIPSILVGDPIRYRQILMNLLDNAVKYTDSGEISVYITLTERTKTHAKVSTIVKDTGIGIPDNKKDILFQPYSMIKDKKAASGTGLGLLISRELSKLMNGEIQFESKEGEGSQFSFTVLFKLFHTEDHGVRDKAETSEAEILQKGIPKEKLIPKEPAAQSVSGKTKKRLLLVEDNPISQNVEMKLLKEVGYDVEAVSNGTDAIDSIQSKPFDLVLMDIEMTDMDGVMATKKIRNLTGDVRRIPIIAVTAHSSMKDREKCLAAGMDDYIAKPINIHFLKMTIDQWLYKKGV